MVNMPPKLELDASREIASKSPFGQPTMICNMSSRAGESPTSPVKKDGNDHLHSRALGLLTKGKVRLEGRIKRVGYEHGVHERTVFNKVAGTIAGRVRSSVGCRQSRESKPDQAG